MRFCSSNEPHAEKLIIAWRVASQFFLVSPRDHFVSPVPLFSEMKEIGVSEKLVSPCLPGLQVATRLIATFLHQAPTHFLLNDWYVILVKAFNLSICNYGFHAIKT